MDSILAHQLQRYQAYTPSRRAVEHVIFECINSDILNVDDTKSIRKIDPDILKKRIKYNEKR